MIEHKDMPEEWTRNGDGWLGPGANAPGAQAGLRGERCITWARVYGVDRATRQEAEQDLLRMVWSLQDGYDPRALRDRALTAEEELAHVRDRLERTEALLATTKGQRQTAEDNYAIMVERMRAYDEVAADDRQRRLRVLDEFDDLSRRLKRTEEALTHDRKRLAAQSVMLRDQQQVIDHLLRPVAVRVLRRITELVRR